MQENYGKEKGRSTRIGGIFRNIYLGPTINCANLQSRNLRRKEDTNDNEWIGRDLSGKKNEVERKEKMEEK